PPPLFSGTTRAPPRSPLFPYTTLFRSGLPQHLGVQLIGAALDLVGVLEEEVDDLLAVDLDAVLLGLLLEGVGDAVLPIDQGAVEDRKSTRLNSSHVKISYAVFCLKKKI